MAWPVTRAAGRQREATPLRGGRLLSRSMGQPGEVDFKFHRIPAPCDDCSFAVHCRRSGETCGAFEKFVAGRRWNRSPRVPASLSAEARVALGKGWIQQQAHRTQLAAVARHNASSVTAAAAARERAKVEQRQQEVQRARLQQEADDRELVRVRKAIGAAQRRVIHLLARQIHLEGARRGVEDLGPRALRG